MKNLVSCILILVFLECLFISSDACAQSRRDRRASPDPTRGLWRSLSGVPNACVSTVRFTPDGAALVGVGFRLGRNRLNFAQGWGQSRGELDADRPGSPKFTPTGLIQLAVSPDSQTLVLIERSQTMHVLRRIEKSKVRGLASNVFFRTGSVDWNLAYTRNLRQLRGDHSMNESSAAGHAMGHLIPAQFVGGQDEAILAISVFGIAGSLGSTQDSSSSRDRLEFWNLFDSDTGLPRLLHRTRGMTLLWSTAVALDGKVLVALVGDESTPAKPTVRLWTVSELDKAPITIPLEGFDSFGGAAEGGEEAESERVKGGRVCVTPDGLKALVQWGNSLGLLDLQRAEFLNVVSNPLPSLRNSSSGLCIHPDGKWAVHASRGCLSVWSLPELQLLGSVTAPGSVWSYGSMTLSPDGSQLVTPGYEPRVWDFNAILKHLKAGDYDRSDFQRIKR